MPGTRKWSRGGRGSAAIGWRAALLALCAVALAAASAPVASAAAGGPLARASSHSHTAAKHAAAKAGDRASRRAVRRCPTVEVSASAGVVRRISIRCRLRNRAQARRANRAAARITNRPDNGAILGVNRRRNLVRYRAYPGVAGSDRFVVVRQNRGVRWRMVVKIDVPAVEPPSPPPAPPARPVRPARPAPPVCQGETKTTNYATPVQLAVTCSGTGVEPLRIAGGPSHGALSRVQRSSTGDSQTFTATYVPDDRFVGSDEVRIVARNAGGRAEGAAKAEVRQWRMRALGDSATAGFGFLGNGTEITLPQIKECEPPATNNDRCSSNSEAGPGYTGPTTWSADFGLANDVSWAAQFANDWQGGGHVTAPQMFQNRAVTGSTPADWLPGGELHGQLEAIVAEDPDLIAFTLGVNPLLLLILEEGQGKACIKGSTTVAALVACVEPTFESVAVRERLEAVYTELLAAPNAEVVTFQYHNAYPWLALFEDEFMPWQVEALIGHLNAEIAAAIGAVRAARPLQASRLTLIEAQVDPVESNALKVPRFNLGVPPDPAQTWTPSFACAAGFTVDGPSHQSTLSQGALPGLFENKFCPGEPWTISADTGIHPNRTGYAQFAGALTNVAIVRDLVPPLP